METQTNTHIINIAEADNKQWLKAQPWNQPGYITEKMQKHAEAGELMGKAPAGYRNVFEHGRKEVVVENEPAKLIQEAFRLMTSGDYSLNQIVATVSAKGLKSRNGKLLQATGLWRILTNPFYCGKTRYKGTLIKGRHHALVSRETFDRVQEVLRSHCRNRQV